MTRWRSSSGTREKKPSRSALLGNADEVMPELVRRGVRPDIVTDQTSAHDPINGYLPRVDARRNGRSGARAIPRASSARPRRRWPSMCGRCSPSTRRGSDCRLRQQHPPDGARGRRRRTRSISRASSRPISGPLFCRGVGPFRWAALSGDPEDIYRTDAKVKELMPDNSHLHNWLDMARARIKFQGLPARICWVGLGDRAPARARLQRHGRARANSRRRSSSAAIISIPAPSPRPTAKPKPCRTAPTRSPTGRCSMRCSTAPSGATWVSIHHGGGVGMGFSQHAGMVVVCDGTAEAARRIERVLWNDPASGVMRHADAGYEAAVECAREKGLDLPSLQLG